jgi:hypothetical protein
VTYINKAKAFDARQRSCLENVLKTSLSDDGWMQAQLGLAHGGFGLRSVVQHAQAAFVGCLAANRYIEQDVKQAVLQQAGIVWDGAADNQSKRSAALDHTLLDVLLSVSSVPERRRLRAVQRRHANAWLLAFPQPGLGCEFSDAEFRVTCLRWLGQPLCAAHVSASESCDTLQAPKLYVHTP